jgi:acyl-CoA synthetase (AMP-forming)/AMP-acid ligase II
MPFPDFPATIPHFIRRIAEQYGSRELLVHEGRRLTYTEAERKSAALARRLLAHGVTKGTRVGILMLNSPEFLLIWLAATRIGAIAIPLNTFYKSKELAFTLHHSDIEILFCLPKFLANNYLDRIEECAPSIRMQKSSGIFVPEFPYLRKVFVSGNSDRVWANSFYDLFNDSNTEINDVFLTCVEACVTPADPIAIIYSSGSTADPKGAVHTHGALIRHSYNLTFSRDIESNDRCFSPMPFFWVGGLIFTLHCVMHKGACLVTEPAFNPEETLKLLERERVTHVSGWPHYGKAMIDHPTFKERDLSAVRAGNIYAILPDDARPKDIELRSNGLGMTETCGPHSLGRMDTDLPESLRGSFGQPLEGIDLKITDRDSGQELPRGIIGELCVRGYSVMQGLYKVERESTFDAFGYYHTGDACYLNDDGYLFFVSRFGDMIKTAGTNVIPREIEILLESQKEIRSAFVVGIPEPHRGEDVAAVIVLKEGCTVDTQTIKQRLKSELSSYKVPKHIFFRRIDDLPFTDSGKIDKRRLIGQLTISDSSIATGV